MPAGRILFLLLPFLLLSPAGAAAQSFYDVSAIQKVELWFSQPNWDYDMDTSKYGKEGYIMADWVKVNGTLFDSVGVKYKGNSSYDSTKKKNPFHIELDTYKQQSYQGFKDIKLSNGYCDPSMIREVLSYSILGNYMDCPRSNFVQLYVNGQYLGLYSSSESVSNSFLQDKFYSSGNTFIKCNPIVNPGPTNKCNLRYINTDSSSYFNFYEIKSAYGWNSLVRLCDSVTNYASSIPNNIDLDRALWMLAFNNVLVNLDSYSGAFCQNYYLYYDETRRYSPIVWDLNMSFGGFPFVGSGFSSTGSLTLTNMQQLPTNIHSTDTFWPLIRNIMSNAMWKRMYLAHLRTITGEFFSNSYYKTLAAQLQAVADTAVQNDPYKFYSYAQFQNGMTGNVPNGSFTIPGISNLMDPRVAYLQTETDFMQVGPSVTSVKPSSTFPRLYSTLTVTAQVSNADANGVYLGYRFGKKRRFERIPMYDDGAHGDGDPGDNLFGTSVTVTDDKVQYYVYAENANAGSFYPARAEHEFLELQVNMDTSTDLKIYPNPADGYVWIKANDGLDEVAVNIYDVLGNKVLETVMSSDAETVISTGELASGLYFINVNGYKIQKLQVIHY